MSEFAEAFGSAAEGTMLARAVEPQHGEEGHSNEVACLNCETPLTGPYCYECGQRAHVHRTLGAFFHDMLHGVLHFEGKLWRTLPAIALRPGAMTRAYIEGQRARFISPIALYLFVVFVTFAALSAMGGTLNLGNLDQEPLVAERLKVESEGLNNLHTMRDLLAGPAGPDRNAALGKVYQNRPVALDEENRETYRRQALAALDRAIPLQEDRVAAWQNLLDEGVETAEFAEDPTSDFVASGVFAGEKSDRSWLDKAWLKAKENPKLLAYKLQNTAYKFGWLLIPISAPLVWLLFVFGSRRYPLYDHAVFVTYSISMCLFLFLIAAVLGKIGLEGLTMLPLLAMPIHIAMQFRGTYPQRRRGFLLRLPLLYLFCLIGSALFITAIMTLGIM